jgi:hypothetical protein
MLIRVTQTITMDGDGDLWDFWWYREAEALMQDWADTLQGFYIAFLRGRFPTATIEVATPVIPGDGPGATELTVELEGTWGDLDPVDADYLTGDALNEALSRVLAVAWDAWQAVHPKDENEDLPEPR